MKLIFVICVFSGLPGFFSCTKDEDNNKTFTFEFSGETEGWSGDFADYPISDSLFYELKYGHSALPSPLNSAVKALKISGNNHSDDLFMFIKHKISGLEPNTSYKIIFDIEFASNAPTGGIGVGGSPGEGVVLKAGATKIEPKKIEDGDYYRMNIDKANQSTSGQDMKLAGNIGVSDTTTVFTIIKRDNSNDPFIATTDSHGEIWAIIGTDSGFEATTTLYYTRIKIVFKK